MRHRPYRTFRFTRFTRRGRRLARRLLALGAEDVPPTKPAANIGAAWMNL